MMMMMIILPKRKRQMRVVLLKSLHSRSILTVRSQTECTAIEKSYCGLRLKWL